jgi:hypothetical protein
VPRWSVRLCAGEALLLVVSRAALSIVDVAGADLDLGLGLAHSTTEDDIYEGYFIPKGSTVLANHW